MDTKMNSICASCGQPLAPNAPHGLCQACLLQAALPTGSAAPAEGPRFQAPPPGELAARFPHLEILELIGSGGMGAVYKVRQKELDRVVALKILPPDSGTDPAFAERFTREAKALAQLNHPNIVTLYEFGRADGLYFFLMEWVDGVNLRQLLHGGRLAPREALAIVPQICDALQYAHDQGIVHRDIKPDNVLLDRRGRVKVADFGLAKLVGRGREIVATRVDAAGPTLTGAGGVMGTPQYMAPEQRAHPGDVDHRADIFALGVVFYQMLTGELPGRHLEPPSKCVQIDVRLDEVVLRALEQEPARRYQQASQLKSQVETITSGPGSILPGWVKPVRWAACILSSLILLAVLPFVFADGLPPLARQPAGVQLTFGGSFVLGLGLLLGWWRQGSAALLIAVGWTVIRISENELLWHTLLELVLVIAGLHAACWWAVCGRQTRRIVYAAAACLLLLVFGRWLCPVNVFMSGSVLDVATGQPVPNAEFRLLPRPPRPPGETDVPDARTDKQGRFRLYIGWYAPQRQVSILAAGYAAVTSSLGDRSLGQRRLQRDFQLALLPSDAPKSPTPAPLRAAAPGGVETEWRDRIADLNQKDWRRAFALGEKLAALPADSGLAILREQWGALTNVVARQQFLKAFAFAHHARLVAVLELGLLDASPAVREWALNYLRDVALWDFAEDYGAAKGWLAARRESSLSEVLAESAREVALRLRGANTDEVVRQLAVLRNPFLFRDQPKLLAGSGLEEALGSLVGNSNQRVVEGALRAAAGLPLSEAWYQRVVLAKLKPDQPVEVRSCAANALESHGGSWAVEPLLQGLTNLCQSTDSGQRSLIAQYAGALGELQATRPIPILIGLIEADNSYETVYGIGYFALGKLTGVAYDQKHDGGWWRAWWETNKNHFPADVQAVEIPKFLPRAPSRNHGGPSQERPGSLPEVSVLKRFAGGDTNKLYFLVGRTNSSTGGSAGLRLLLVLPGGDGGPDFQPFVQAIWQKALPPGYLAAQLVAPKWDAAQAQKLVWPTEKNPYPAMKFPTETFVRAVVAEVGKLCRLDTNRIYVLAWSSGGPAAYAVSLDPRTQVTGAFVAMSVFAANTLPELAAAKRESYFLLHSPEDFIPLRMAEAARDELSKHGARVRLETYEGGHGWHGDVFGNIRTGIEWLEAGNGQR